MKYPDFIKFFTGMPKCDKELHTANTVQLKPYSLEPYTFLLPVPQYSELENLIFVDEYGNEDNNVILSAITESVNGNTILKIHDIQHNSWGNCYLKVKLNDYSNYLISTPFRVSLLELENTTYIKYKDHDWTDFGGIRINMMHWHQMSKNEITTYYQVTREQTISVGSKRDRVERYWLDNISIFCVNALLDILTLPVIYIDEIRSFTYEMPEVDPLTARENFVSFEINVTQDVNDTSITPTRRLIITNKGEYIQDHNNNYLTTENY